MAEGRIEVYVHSDSTTENKGGVIIKVTCRSDFAARTDVFKRFTREAAMLVYGAMAHTRSFAGGPEMWRTVIDKFPELETKRLAIESELREPITVIEMRLLRL